MLPTRYGMGIDAAKATTPTHNNMVGVEFNHWL